MPWLLALSATPSVPTPATLAPLGGQALSEAPTQLDGVVVAARRGAARQAPELEFDGAEVDALGAGDIGEVVSRLNETMGGRGSPIVIVNGKRLADPEVFMSLPADALARVEFLPTSASAAYGGVDPSRRVVNIVLQQKFVGRDALLSVKRPTEAGAEIAAADLRRSSIHEMDINQFGAWIERDSALRADERSDYMVDHPGRGSTTLRPQTERLAANFSVTRAMGAWRGSLGGNLQSQSSHFVSVPDGQDLLNRTRQRSLNLTGGLTGEMAHWSLRASAAGQLSRADSAGQSSTSSESRSLNLSLSASRNLLELPTGPVPVELSAQASRGRFFSEQDVFRSRFQTQSGEIRAQVSLPIFSAAASDDVMPRRGPGELNVSLGGGAKFTDLGRGHAISAGLNWAPAKAVSFNGAWSRTTETPSYQQRFAPARYGTPTVVFDFRDSRAVEISPLTGGNSLLRVATQDIAMAGLAVGPFTTWRISGRVNYRHSKSSNEIGSLPEPTIDIEAAFPERFKRDDQGRLIGLDLRPINIGSRATSALQSNLNAALPTPVGPGGASARVQVSLNHIWRFDDLTQIHQGLPRMNRLAGDGGGTPRHELVFRLDGRRGAWGLNATADWKSGYRIRRDVGRDGGGDLAVKAMGTTNLELSYDVPRRASFNSPLAGAPPTRRRAGLTLTLGIDNLLDTRPSARLADNRAVAGYGRDDRDPLGRLVRLALAGRF
ncbi:TonB-dependent receptor [Caulobacter sp. LjRoot300]|uniref:TonB-dependent receptor n=1 Tax=Caulobacter sp. LjRoot300 TaxID=3342321 RepID=UPI003ED03768